MDDKIIVTNLGALTAKYGAKGVTAIRKAVTALIAADKARGLRTRLLYLDDAATMKRVKGKPVERVSDYRATKAAIDAIYKSLQPDYLMLLGAPDVIAHQNLTNPAAAAGDDDDPIAWSDLPYACDGAYQRDPAKYIGPTRVVGRLPDATGAQEPSHLLALLKTASSWKSRPATDYARYFGLSTQTWQGSSRLSLDAIFGNSSKLKLSPPKGPRHGKTELGALTHFINCHGAPFAPEFYGEKGTAMPVSLTTAATARNIRAGTIVAAECCYGAELYDAAVIGVDQPICQSYLQQGAYAYFGSTTIAYGPADDNGIADLICQYFLLQILGGASVGRAALAARQQFVAQSGQMDAIDLKTLAQFCVYGDPSVHPVAVAHAAPAKGTDVETEIAARLRRNERRKSLEQTGEFLQQTKATASRPRRGARIGAQTKTALANIAAKSGLSREQSFAMFKVSGGRERSAAVKATRAPSNYMIAVGKAKAGAKLRVVVVAKEMNGRIMDYRIYHER